MQFFQKKFREIFGQFLILFLTRRKIARFSDSYRQYFSINSKKTLKNIWELYIILFAVVIITTKIF